MLEALAVDLGVEVDGVLAGDDVREGRAGLALSVGLLSTGHCTSCDERDGARESARRARERGTWCSSADGPSSSGTTSTARPSPRPDPAHVPLACMHTLHRPACRHEPAQGRCDEVREGDFCRADDERARERRRAGRGRGWCWVCRAGLERQERASRWGLVG